MSFENVHLSSPDVTVDISFEQLSKKVNEAQKWLDMHVFEDTIPYIPMDTGALTEQTRQANIGAEGSGSVIIGRADYVRYVWEGMSHTGNPLHYQHTHHPYATHHWFEESLRVNHDKWVEGVKNIIYGR